MKKDIYILGVKFLNIDNSLALEKIKLFLSIQGKNLVVTPNPEILLLSQTNFDLFHILHNANLILPDGIGLKFAAWAVGKNITRIHGSDFAPQILKLASEEKRKVGIFVWNGGLSNENEITKELHLRYPDLDFLVEEVDRQVKFSELRKNWNSFSPEIIFVGLGAPWQEIIANDFLHKISSVKVSMVVGGSFDFITGKASRAPKIIRSFGFEWMWRLLRKPTGHSQIYARWKRIFNAVIIFPCVVISRSYIRPFFYRKNVAAFIFNSENEVLLVNWAQNNDYWGIPQGGVDSGESDLVAVKREMMEEIGNNNFEVVGYYKNIYKYLWPPSYCRSGYKGQRQSLFLLKFTGKKEDIVLSPHEHKDSKWVKIDKLLEESHPVHKTGYTIFLNKFKELK